MIHRYFRLNSAQEDFISITCKLFTRLVNQGYQKKDIKELIMDSINNLINKHSPTSETISNPDPNPPLIFKTTYHKGIIRSHLRDIIYKNLESSLNNNNLPLDRLIIAFKRQRNIKELLSPSKLYVPLDLSIPSIRMTPVQYYLRKGYCNNNIQDSNDAN